MKVKDLIEILQECDAEAEVGAANDERLNSMWFEVIDVYTRDDDDTVCLAYDHDAVV